MKVLVLVPCEGLARLASRFISSLSRPVHEYQVVCTGFGRANGAMEAAMELSVRRYDLVYIIEPFVSAYAPVGDIIWPNVCVCGDSPLFEGTTFDLSGDDECSLVSVDNLVPDIDSLNDRFGPYIVCDTLGIGVCNVAVELGVDVLVGGVVSDSGSLVMSDVSRLFAFLERLS